MAVSGSDGNSGKENAPFRTIQHAADLAQPGEAIVVHEGVYRERVNPPRGGSSNSMRIVYRAVPGERVEIKGSEVIKGWVEVQDDVWQVTLADSFFGCFNPYTDLIRGDWFDCKERKHHTGAVYLNGEWLTEALEIDDILKPVGGAPLWFGWVQASNTTLWAQFVGVNPNEQLVEINVRRTVFYPEQPGRNFITVNGFVMRHAATPWAPPTAEQIGLIGTHWSKGWIIENNTISHSVCAGISLGKYGDEFDNSSANSAEGYLKTIERAHSHPIPWTRENIGHHIVRANTISHCEQAGIVGSLGCSFSTVSGNFIHDIHVRQLFSGAEMAGIKFHGAIDTEINGNHIHHANRGLWLDWMAQGTRVSRNLFHDNTSEDLFVEVNHGPFVVDNNIFLSPVNVLDWSEGGAYAHNLMIGKIINSSEPRRETPYHPAHSTQVAGLVNIEGGDDRFINNIFVGVGANQDVAPVETADWRGIDSGYGLWVYDNCEFPLQTGGNVYYYGARPYAREVPLAVSEKFNPVVVLVGRSLSFELIDAVKDVKTALVTTKLLGETRVTRLPYLNSDGLTLNINTDYFGNRRNESNPAPGPFECASEGGLVKVLPFSSAASPVR